MCFHPKRRSCGSKFQNEALNWKSQCFHLEITFNTQSLHFQFFFISFAFRTFVQHFLFLNMIQTRNHIWTKHDTPLPIEPLIRGNRMFTYTALKFHLSQMTRLAQDSPSVSWQSELHVLWSWTRVASSHMTKKQASLICIYKSSTWKTWSTVILHWWMKGLQGCFERVSGESVGH